MLKCTEVSTHSFIGYSRRQGDVLVYKILIEN